MSKASTENAIYEAVENILQHKKHASIKLKWKKDSTPTETVIKLSQNSASAFNFQKSCHHQNLTVFMPKNALQINKTISVLLQNMQCIRNKIYELEVLLQNDFSQVDVLHLIEHWLQKNEAISLTLPTFKIVNIFVGKITRIEVRNSINCKSISITVHLNDELNFEHSATLLPVPDPNTIVV